MRFFEPSPEFLDWLAQYAKDRVVFDIGCGEGHILVALQERKIKTLGCDPAYQYQRMPLRLMSCVLPYEGKDCRVIRQTKNSLVLFCRPCHSGFVADTIRLLPESAEILYISKPENVEVDLFGMETELVETPPCPEEKVYRVTNRGD